MRGSALSRKGSRRPSPLGRDTMWMHSAWHGCGSKPRQAFSMPMMRTRPGMLAAAAIIAGERYFKGVWIGIAANTSLDVVIAGIASVMVVAIAGESLFRRAVFGS